LICPICNALSLLIVSCPNCGAPAEDEGRSDDWAGPYSPYEPDLISFREFSDSEGTICQHSVRCVGCHFSFLAEIPAWHI
jgi:hypothetical protein